LSASLFIAAGVPRENGPQRGLLLRGAGQVAGELDVEDYSHVSPELQRDAMDRQGALLFGTS